MPRLVKEKTKGRGFKQCPNCNKKAGVRTKVCQCSYKFEINHLPKSLRKKSGRSIDLNDIKLGDTIRIIQGSGPVWICSDGREEACGHSGKYKVLSIDKNGFRGYDLDRGGQDYIYMGDTIKIESLIRKAHKIKLLKRIDNAN